MVSWFKRCLCSCLSLFSKEDTDCSVNEDWYQDVGDIPQQMTTTKKKS